MSEVFTIDTVAQAFGGQHQQPQFKPAGYHFVEFMKQMKSPVVLEIGCDVGDTSQLLLDCNESLKLYTIDPYDDYIDWNGNNLNERQKLYEQARVRFAQYGDIFKARTSPAFVTLAETYKLLHLLLRRDRYRIEVMLQ